MILITTCVVGFYSWQIGDRLVIAPTKAGSEGTAKGLFIKVCLLCLFKGREKRVLSKINDTGISPGEPAAAI